MQGHDLTCETDDEAYVEYIYPKKDRVRAPGTQLWVRKTVPGHGIPARFAIHCTPKGFDPREQQGRRNIYQTWEEFVDEQRRTKIKGYLLERTEIG